MAANEERVVAIMGLTGSGKSSLIQKATGNSRIRIGHSLSSETKTIQDYQLTLDDRKYRLVDTQGFDDPEDADEVVTERLLEWLESTFRKGQRLNGIIYVHRINQPRMEGSARQNKDMFQRLCGPQCFDHVVLATTFWDRVSESEGKKRQTELCTNKEFWGLFVEKGSKVLAVTNDRSSVISAIKAAGGHDKMTLQAQHEIVVEGRRRQDTDAAQHMERQKQIRVEREKKLEAERRRIARQQEEENRERQRKAQALREADAARLREQERKREEERQEEEKRIREAREKARCENEERERKERERLAAEQKRLAEREAARQARQIMEEVAAFRRRQQDHSNRQRWCIKKRPFGGCDRCGNKLSRYEYTYHCCSCRPSDDYWQCGACGNDCGVQEHPYMMAWDNTCTVM